MSKVGVSLKIDVTNIDKARLFKGNKGTYLDATVFIDLDKKDEYGNSGMITQNVSKEERAQGVSGEILGNCSVFWGDSSQRQQAPSPQQQQQPGGYTQQQPQQAPPPPPAMDSFDDNIPF